MERKYENINKLRVQYFPPVPWFPDGFLDFFELIMKLYFTFPPKVRYSGLVIAAIHSNYIGENYPFLAY